MELRGVVNSKKLDYDKLFAVFYDIKEMNAEVVAKGLEKLTFDQTSRTKCRKFGWLWLSKNSRSCQNGKIADLL